MAIQHEHAWEGEQHVCVHGGEERGEEGRREEGE